MHRSKSAPRLERQLLVMTDTFCSLPHMTTPLRLHVLRQQLIYNKMVHVWGALSLSLPSCGKQRSI